MVIGIVLTAPIRTVKLLTGVLGAIATITDTALKISNGEKHLTNIVLIPK